MSRVNLDVFRSNVPIVTMPRRKIVHGIPSKVSSLPSTTGEHKVVPGNVTTYSGNVNRTTVGATSRNPRPVPINTR